MVSGVSYRYIDGQNGWSFYNHDKQYGGGDAFADALMEALAMIQSGPVGATLVNSLVESDKTIHIKEGKINWWNPDETYQKMKSAFTTLFFIFFSVVTTCGQKFVNPETEILKDSLVKVYELPEKTYRNLNLSGLDRTIVSIIKQIQPYISDFNPKNKITPYLELSSSDTICVFFDHTYSKWSLSNQKIYGHQGNYSWFVASTGKQYFYACRGDSIIIYPPFFTDERGTPYNGFYKHFKKLENKKERKSKVALAVCL